MSTVHIIAAALIILITIAAPPAAADTACETLLAADQDGDGKVTSADALIQLQAGNPVAAILILRAAAAGSINALIPGCYQPPFLVHFTDAQPNTTLFCNDWGIETPLPATVELQDHIVDYQFEVIDDDHPVGDPLMYFILRASSAKLKCLSVNWYEEKCGSTTPPGVVVTESERTVEIYSPQEPYTVGFTDAQAGTYLYEEDMNIHVPLPATVELKGHLPGYYNYIDYTFEIHPGEDAIPTEDALMFFAIRACPEELYCQWVDFGTGCGSTTPPGVVVDQANRTVEIFSPPITTAAKVQTLTAIDEGGIEKGS